MFRQCAVAAGSALTVLASAQVITTDDMPYDGLSVVFIGCPYVPITQTGEAQTWDMSSLAAGASEVADYVLPEATSSADDFPDADIAELTGLAQTFYRLDATGMFRQGVWDVTNSILIRYTDEAQTFAFPMAFGSAHTDTYEGAYDFSSGHVDLVGTYSDTADGYGTLMLPWGTLANVLRISLTEVTTETLGADTYVRIIHAVRFYKPGVHLHLLQTSDVTLTMNGAPLGAGQFMGYISANSVGVAELKRNDIGLEAFPVPAHDRLNVVYSLDAGQATTITLCDASGRTVRTFGSVTGATGVQRADLDVAGLPAGMYLLRITDERGQRGMRKVVIE